MMQKAYTLLIEDNIVLTCCPERARSLEKEYNCKVLYYIEKPLVAPPHCDLGCLKDKKEKNDGIDI